MTRPVDCPELEEWKDRHMRPPPWFANAFRQAIERCRHASYPGGFAGRGIVTCAGGPVYGPLGERLVNRLRDVGCTLPVQAWRLPEEIGDGACADPAATAKRGWALKILAIMQCPFAEVLFLDADNWPLRDPTFCFDHGTTFWTAPDVCPPEQFAAFGMGWPNQHVRETGQLLVDKRADWTALLLVAWLNEHADDIYRASLGDAFTFELAWLAVAAKAQVIGPARAETWGLLHDGPDGLPLFQHRCWSKQ